MEKQYLSASAKTHYKIECFDRNGNLKWVEEFDNLVVTAGLNLLLDRSFKNVPADVNWYVGLKGTGTIVAGDTMASHGGWTEITVYDEANRPTLTLGSISAGSVDNAASKAVFTISGTATVAGAFSVNNNTKGGSTGTLYGAGDFGSPRSVVDNDVLNVQITISATAA